MLTDGLNAVDAAAKAAHGGGFSTLTADRQDAVLRTIARAEEGKDQGFFRLIRSATILGTSPRSRSAATSCTTTRCPAAMTAASRSTRSADATGPSSPTGFAPQ